MHMLTDIGKALDSLHNIITLKKKYPTGESIKVKGMVPCAINESHQSFVRIPHRTQESAFIYNTHLL